MFEKKKFLLLLLLGLPANSLLNTNENNNNQGITNTISPKKTLQAIVSSDKETFEENYKKILAYITSDKYLEQLSSPENSGFFLNETFPQHFDIHEIPELLNRIANEVRNQKYDLFGAFKIFEGVPLEKASKNQTTMVGDFATAMTQLPIPPLDSNIDKDIVIPSILTSLRSPVDTNMFLISKNICNMPSIKNQIKDPELEKLIGNSFMERLFRKNAFNNTLSFKKTIEINDEEIEDLKKKLISINKKIDETYSNLKKGLEYIKYLPIELNAFYKFISSEERMANIKGPLKEDIEYLIAPSMQNQIVLSSALKKLVRSTQEKLITANDTATFPSTIQSIKDFLSGYGSTLTEEEKNAIYNAAANYIFSTGVIQQKAYLPGTKFYNGQIAAMSINTNIPLKEKLKYILDNLFTSKKITFGSKLTPNNFSINFSSFFKKNKLYENFLDIIQEIKNLSIDSSKFFNDKKDIFALDTNLALSEMILALTNSTQTPKDQPSEIKRINFLAESPYATLYLNKNKDILANTFEAGLLTLMKPILGNLMPYDINRTQSKNPILRAENIYNIQTQQTIDGKFDLTGTQLLFGPAGSGKSSFFKTIIGAIQLGAFIGMNKSYINITTSEEEAPTFVYEKNMGELNNELINAGLSNYQTNLRKIIDLGIFLESSMNKRKKIITLLDEIFAAGNPKTVSGFIEQSAVWKKMLEKVMGTLIIEHNIETLTSFPNSKLNIIGQKIIGEEQTFLANKDLAPFEKTITEAEKEFLAKHKEDPRFYFMLDVKTKQIVSIGKDYYNKNKTSSDNQFFSVTFDLSKIQYTDPDYRNENSTIKFLCYPEFHLISGTKNNDADSKFMFWGRIEPIFEKDSDGTVKSVTFQLVKTDKNETIPYFKTDSSSIATEGIFQISTEENKTKSGQNKTMTFFLNTPLQQMLNKYICQAAELAITIYNNKLLQAKNKDK